MGLFLTFLVVIAVAVWNAKKAVDTGLILGPGDREPSGNAPDSWALAAEEPEADVQPSRRNPILWDRVNLNMTPEQIVACFDLPRVHSGYPLTALPQVVRLDQLRRHFSDAQIRDFVALDLLQQLSMAPSSHPATPVPPRWSPLSAGAFSAAADPPSGTPYPKWGERASPRPPSAQPAEASPLPALSPCVWTAHSKQDSGGVAADPPSGAPSAAEAVQQAGEAVEHPGTGRTPFPSRRSLAALRLMPVLRTLPATGHASPKGPRIDLSAAVVWSEILQPPLARRARRLPFLRF